MNQNNLPKNDVKNPISQFLIETSPEQKPYRNPTKSDHEAYMQSKSESAPQVIQVPNMWELSYIGLYAQYAAVGLLGGSTSYTASSFCPYVFEGEPNVCSNASNIAFFAWNLKIFYAIGTDIYRPFGLRRKPYMIFGWCGVLFLLFILAVAAHKMSASAWLSVLLCIQGFLMFSDVPADGYSVELGQLEPIETRGNILATGQMVRFAFSIIASFIQAFFLNGPSTNPSDCTISPENCWAWGFNVNEYYGFMFCCILVLVIPIYWLKELPPKDELHSLNHFISDIWDTLQNRTTLFLMIYVIGTNGLSNLSSVVNYYLQFYIIELTNFQVGIDGITTNLVLTAAIWIFKKHLINKNWRTTNYCSNIFSAIMGLLWIPAYWNSSGTRTAYYTIFVDIDQSFISGISQVLFSMAVIELAKPGLEATTYELLISVNNAARTVGSVIATQLLTPLKATGCTESPCPSDQVDVANGSSGFEDSDGPQRYTVYCLWLVTISVIGTIVFTQFLPKSKEECHIWREMGLKAGLSREIGYISLFLALFTVFYGFVSGVLLLDSDTSCLEGVGGQGC